MCCEQKDSGKVGDTLTATVKGMAAAKYEWSLNGTVQATTATYEVPASAKSGDRIKVVVTAEDGETAEDTVYVGGFTILLVEPTTDADTNGYKYLRAEFSSALAGLEPEDIEIRAKKNNQLYSVESVKLSSDGTSADITLFGSVLEGGTKFLQPATIYTMAITNNGITDTYEFELPKNLADELVTAVDIAGGKITVQSTYSANRKGAGTANKTYKIGDLYDGNLGELVGRTVNIGVNSDGEVTTFSVNDAEVVFEAVQAKEGNDSATFGDSNKDYLVAPDKSKYYWSVASDETSAVTQTYVLDVKGKDWTISPNADDKFDYAKLVLNPTATVSCAVLENWEGMIVATTTDGTVAVETKNNTKDFKDFTIVENGVFIDPTELEAGDVIYYNDTDKFAEVYNNAVVGSLDAVYTSSAKVDGTEYKWAGYDEAYETNARYYDADNEKYVDVTEKWLLAADTTEDVTFTLDRNNNAVLIETVQGESVTTTHDYIITKAPVAYLNGVDQMMDIGVSDGTKATLKIALSDLKYVNGSEKDTWKAVKTADNTDVDTKTAGTAFKLTGKDSGAMAGAAATEFPVDSLLRVTYNSDEDIIGIEEMAIETTMQKHADVAFKPGLTQLATQKGKVALTASTNVYVITGKEADDSDETVTKVAYADYAKTTKAGSLALTGGEFVYSKVFVYVDKTTATDIVIDASAGAGKAAAALLVAGDGNGNGSTTENEIFAEGEVKTTVVGVVKSAKTGLDADQDKTILKELTVMNAAAPSGETYSDFKNEIASAGLTAKNTIVSIDLDADGDVLAVNAVGATAGDPGAADVSKYDSTARLACTSTEYVRARNNFIRPTSSAFVAFYDGNSWTTTSIGAINREDAKFGTITYFVSEIDGDDISSEIIIASGAGAPTFTTLNAVVTTTNSTTGWTLPTTTTPATFSTTLGFKDDQNVPVSADELTVGTIVDGDALKVDNSGTLAKSAMSFSGGVFKVTLTNDVTDPNADQAGTATIPVTYNGEDYLVTVTIANDGKVTAGTVTAAAAAAAAATADINTAAAAVIAALDGTHVDATAATTKTLPAATDGCTFTYALTTAGTVLSGFAPATRVASINALTAAATTDSVVTLTITKGTGTAKTVAITFGHDGTTNTQCNISAS